jgi:hypothetical protein
MQKAQASRTIQTKQSLKTNAFDRLRQAQDRLQQSNGQSGRRVDSRSSGRRQQISDLRQRAAQAASRQRKSPKTWKTHAVEVKARRMKTQKSAREQLASEKIHLPIVNSLQQDIEQSARSMVPPGTATRCTPVEMLPRHSARLGSRPNSGRKQNLNGGQKLVLFR